jgi:hypothetical protein
MEGGVREKGKGKGRTSYKDVEFEDLFKIRKS